MFTWNPSPRSVLKDLTRVFATTTKIFTSSRFRLAHASPFNAHHHNGALRPIKAVTALTIEYWEGARAPSIFRASCFGRWVVTHSLADFDFHGHRPAVYSNQHLFMGSDERPFRSLNSAFDSSHSFAYQKWPTRCMDSNAGASTQASQTSHPFKVWE